MSSSPDAVLRQWFQEVWNERREEAIDRLMAADARVHGLAGGVIVGPAAFKPFHQAMCGAFSELQVDIDQVVVESDRVAVHCRVKGRHTGDTLGGKATDKPVDFTGVTIARVENGNIVEGWNNFDFLTMYQQLGWVALPVA